ncbi:MAG: hypothetical protein AB1744_01365 [Candidatus Zixiibacteriota bacterium]
MTKDTPMAESARERFEATAQKLGCDEDESAFEAKLRQIAKAKPKPPDGKLKHEKAPE